MMLGATSPPPPNPPVTDPIKKKNAGGIRNVQRSVSR
jgi:hypothetical protein